MKIEDKKSTGGEVTVELDKNLIERTVGWLQGCIATEDTKLWAALFWSIPKEKRKEKKRSTNALWFHILTIRTVILSYFKVLWEMLLFEFIAGFCLLNHHIT